MSSRRTTLEQADHLAPPPKNADPATPTSQRLRLFSRLQPALKNNFHESSEAVSDSNLPTEDSPVSQYLNPQTHPSTASQQSSKQSRLRTPSGPQTKAQTAEPASIRVPYSEFERDYGDTDLESLPAGFPYNGWYGAWCFACEYVRSMQALVTERMEESGKYGMVRRTT